jgi:hypothetical protein
MTQHPTTFADWQTAILKSDPKHTSLHVKQAGRFWSVPIGMSWRALAIDEGDDMIWFWIGSHTDYDKIIHNR